MLYECVFAVIFYLVYVIYTILLKHAELVKKVEELALLVNEIEYSIDELNSDLSRLTG